MGLSGGERGLGRTRIQREQQLALAHEVAVLEVDRLDVAADAGAHVDRARRFKSAGDFVPVDDLTDQRRGHGHRRGLGCGGFASLGTAIESS
ncbi:hypothetical protein D3C72_1514880 [compost metagenome]